MWDAKLCEALVTRNLKGKIVGACPNIQIGEMPNSSSVEHLVTMKIFMKMIEESNNMGIINTFDMEKFFDFVSELGCKQSIDDKIKYRIQKLTSKANDILLIADAPQLGAEGTSTAAIKLFERR